MKLTKINYCHYQYDQFSTKNNKGTKRVVFRMGETARTYNYSQKSIYQLSRGDQSILKPSLIKQVFEKFL